MTLGSPFRDLYLRFFVEDYPPLDAGHWQGLWQRLSRWYNIFRTDDFVGTSIAPHSARPVNRPVDPGGHTDYWTDRQVVDLLIRRRLV